MTQALIICEKPKQARAVGNALGGRYGKVLHARGHILRLETPNEVEPKWDVLWSQWDAEAMLPPTGIYKYMLSDDPQCVSFYQEIARNLKHHDTVIIATDPDREGQSIGDEILAHAGFKGKVMRALYNNENDPADVLAAFNGLRDNREFRSQYEAAYARQNIDQIFGMSLTRLVTRELRRLGWAGHKVRGKQSSKIGIGRVRSPIWGMICQREVEIRDFVPSDYFELSLPVQGDAGRAVLWHKRGAEDRILDRKAADAIAAEAAGFKGPIAVKMEAKRSSPPNPADLPTLQKRASALWGWKATHTLDVLQSLYEKNLVTYPRAETRFLPETMIAEAVPMLTALRALPAFSSYPLQAPVIRTGAKGVFSDKALEKIAHHAVVPKSARMAEFGQARAGLGADEGKLFDLIAAFYVAAIGEPHRYDRTELSVTVPGAPQATSYNTVGIVVRDAGWKAAFKMSGGDAEGGTGPKESALPPFKNGEPVSSAGAEVHAKVTSPPPRYTDGTIINEMMSVWKRVEDKDLQQRLKATNGLGTPATRHTFIKEIEADSLMETDKKGQLRPTDDGLVLYEVLAGCCPPLFDPAGTAQLEVRLDDVLHERAGMLAVIAEAADTTRGYIERIETWAKAQGALFKNPPTEPMLNRAREAAKKMGVTLPADVIESRGACREWLDRHVGSTPSEAQVDLARKVAERLGQDVPADVLADRTALSKWLDAMKPKADAIYMQARAVEPASEKQRAVIERAIGEGKLKAPDGWPELNRLDASALLDQLFSKGKDSGNGKAAAGGKKGGARKPAAAKNKAGGGRFPKIVVIKRG